MNNASPGEEPSLTDPTLEDVGYNVVELVEVLDVLLPRAEEVVHECHRAKYQRRLRGLLAGYSSVS
jgi:hypothetical protein